MRQIKRWTTLALLVFSLLIFTACGESLQKPTGLEEDSQTELNAESDSEAANENEDGEEKADKKKSSEDEKEDSKKEKETELAKKEKESKSDKDSNDKSDSKKTKDDSSKQSSQSQDTNKSTSNSSTKSTTKTDSSKDKKSSQSSSSNKQSDKSNKQSNKDTSSKPKKESGSTNKKPAEPKKDTVSISIVISSSEVPLSATQVEISDGDKVVDVLNKVTKDKGIHRDITNGNNYVAGLANVYEFDRGQGSGWMYRINGVFPDRGVGAVSVQNGDRIEFLYTMDLGKDLNANLQPFRR